MRRIEELEAPDSGAVRTATSVVLEALERMVLGDLSPGASLPSEGSLATRFGVSRLTVREAVKMLAGRGLLDVGRGRRAVVTEPSGAAFTDFLSSVITHDPKGMFDLIELRVALESHAAALAAKRAGRAAVAHLEATLLGMRAAVEAGRSGVEGSELRFHDQDIAFHETIALSSGNRLISYVFEAMVKPLRHSFYLSRRGRDLRGHTIDDTINAHKAIIEAVRAGDAKRAGAVMRGHLEDSESDVRAGLNAERVEPIVWGAEER